MAIDRIPIARFRCQRLTSFPKANHRGMVEIIVNKTIPRLKARLSVALSSATPIRNVFRMACLRRMRPAPINDRAWQSRGFACGDRGATRRTNGNGSRLDSVRSVLPVGG